MELGNSACACVPRIFRVKLADCERVVNFFPLSSEHGGQMVDGFLCQGNVADDGHERSCLTSETHPVPLFFRGTCNEICLRSAPQHRGSKFLSFYLFNFFCQGRSVAYAADVAATGPQKWGMGGGGNVKGWGGGQGGTPNKHIKSLLRILFVCALG